MSLIPSHNERRLSPRHSRISTEIIAENVRRRIQHIRMSASFLFPGNTTLPDNNEERDYFFRQTFNEIDFENAAEQARVKSPKRSRRIRRRSVNCAERKA